MSTRLSDMGDHWVVATETSKGRRRKLGRNPVRVEKGDRALLKAEVLRQALAARKAAGVKQEEATPVV